MSGHGHTPTDPSKLDMAGMRVGMIAYAGIVGTVLIYVLIVAIQVWFYNEQNAEHAERIKEPNQKIRAYHARENERLRTARWISEDDKDHVAIPIDAAMKLYVEDQTK